MTKMERSGAISWMTISALLCFYWTSCLVAEQQPNIVWMFSDDHAPNAVGAYGGRFKNENITPHLDQLAAEGMIFDRAYVANSICAPSRATLLTGKHSHLNGKYNNRDQFNHNQNQFQKVLQKHGYKTAMVGKIHLNGAMQGFDYWEVLPGQGAYTNPKFVTEEGGTQYEGHSSDIITDRALRWLKNDRQDGPFMLMVHYKAPHRNWTPAPRNIEAFKDRTFPEPDNLFDDYRGRGFAALEQDLNIEISMRLEKDNKIGLNGFEYRTKKYNANPPEGKDLVRWKYQAYMQDYLACVHGVDQNIGRILDYLKENGLDKNTIVMYSSDQGFYLGEHGWFDKRFMYEESYRTPLIVRWPGIVKAGTRNADLVQNIDFASTFLNMAGATIPSDMQGKSLVPLMKGDTPSDWRESLYYRYYEYPGAHSVRRHEGVSTKRYKLIRYYGHDVPSGEEWELFDLQKDPSEMRSEFNNPEYATIIKTLKKELGKLKQQYQVPADEFDLADKLPNQLLPKAKPKKKKSK
jgi:arylsulfatase A-like enzyme